MNDTPIVRPQAALGHERLANMVDRSLEEQEPRQPKITHRIERVC